MHLISGLVIVEIVFVYPSIGQLLLDSVSFQDIPVMQACGMILTAITVFLVKLADVVGIAQDPRVAEHYAVDNERIERIDWRQSAALRRAMGWVLVFVAICALVFLNDFYQDYWLDAAVDPGPAIQRIEHID